MEAGKEKAGMANLRKIHEVRRVLGPLEEFPVPREQTCSISNGWEQPRKGGLSTHLWWWVKGAEAGAVPWLPRAARSLSTRGCSPHSKNCRGQQMHLKSYLALSTMGGAQWLRSEEILISLSGFATHPPAAHGEHPPQGPMVSCPSTYV